MERFLVWTRENNMQIFGKCCLWQSDAQTNRYNEDLSRMMMAWYVEDDTKKKLQSGGYTKIKNRWLLSVQGNKSKEGSIKNSKQKNINSNNVCVCVCVCVYVCVSIDACVYVWLWVRTGKAKQRTDLKWNPKNTLVPYIFQHYNLYIILYLLPCQLSVRVKKKKELVLCLNLLKNILTVM